MTSPRLDAGSFRDRSGRVFYRDGRVYRALSEPARQAWETLSASRFFSRAVEEGKIVSSREVDLDAGDGLKRDDLRALPGPWVAALEHQRVPFVSYPYEWSFSMLRDGALLTLELLHAALREDLILKDASAYNVQWRGCRPMLIDVGSFEPWRPGAPWVGYLQFCQLFLYPLLLTAYRDVPFQPWLRGAIDGIEPVDCRRLLRQGDRLRPGVLVDVDLMARLQAKENVARPTNRKELERAGFGKEMIARNVTRLERIVSRLRWRRASSEWADYERESSYGDADREIKMAFVERVAKERRRDLVWDLGANTGAYSRLVAPHAETVVALDADHLAVERLYRRLREEGPDNVLPLVANLADASPGLGWRLRERRPLADRGRPDLVLSLALVHHLVIRHNVPLPELVAWLAELGGELVIEWVAKDDAMVQKLLANKDDVYDDYAPEVFEACLEERYEIAARETFHGGTRTLYHARPRG